MCGCWNDNREDTDALLSAAQFTDSRVKKKKSEEKERKEKEGKETLKFFHGMKVNCYTVCQIHGEDAAASSFDTA